MPDGNNNDRKPAVVITGASGGIGADLARIFSNSGYSLVLVARSEDKLQALAEELSTRPAAADQEEPLVMVQDLETSDAAAILARRLAEQKIEPAILVNNAGFGLNGPFSELELTDQMALLQLNIATLTSLTYALLPGIVRQKGRILNVASVAAFFPGPGMAVYYASKAYVLSFSQALTHELAPKGVTVSVLCPGPTESGFFRRAGATNAKHKNIGLMASMPVAQAGYDGLMSGKRVIVPGLQNKIFALASGIIPVSLAMKVIGRLQMNRRKQT